ncbi:MAG TPA: hypothetical protein DEF47_07675 [Herpetosiphon sp.]|uniref:GerMN domain-containing protein n=1 Tax=Herpetosiphon aurantiacus (strain ATCC 23779 / DSM 785 / 114-95) TaxID=316274 RepID=A9B751_HERA2|nr:Gmad2 immunoglobulin-like domain-containing protein [Herpetosiphon sp.]ABX06334.1 hypothetical protein Haur_3698 [Herpetosiphon aurantiacus DSM 785]HBW49770.1 hypothetical protein [Herpetosiphon sp.]
MRSLKYISLALLLVACGGQSPATTTPAATTNLPAQATATIQTGSAATTIPTTVPQATGMPQATVATANQINLSAPPVDAVLTDSVRVAGTIVLTPFEKTLRLVIQTNDGNILYEGPINTTGEYGSSATFDVTVPIVAAASGPGVIKVIEDDMSGELPYRTIAEQPVQFTSTSAEPTPAEPGILIELTEPAMHAVVGNPLNFKGTLSAMPFEKNVVIEVYDSELHLLGQTSVIADGEYGSAGTFSGSINFQAPLSSRIGRIVAYTTSPKDGSVVGRDEATLTLPAWNGTGAYLAQPAPETSAFLPLHVEAVGLSSDTYTVRLRYADGTLLENTTQAYNGYLALSLMWDNAAPILPNQSAILELVKADGTVELTQNLYMQDLTSQPTTSVEVSWLAGEGSINGIRILPKTSSVASAALRELVWGPVGKDSAYSTAIPSPKIIADYTGDKTGWTGRVHLRSVRIEGDIAYVDWSREMRAWGGGSMQLESLQAQVDLTLKQFSQVKQVVMTVEGSEEVLQP